LRNRPLSLKQIPAGIARNPEVQLSKKVNHE
jgi:hypothetical protein